MSTEATPTRTGWSSDEEEEYENRSSFSDRDDPYASDEFHSDVEYVDETDVSVASARCIAAELKEKRRIMPFVCQLRRSRITKEVLENSDLQEALALHAHLKGCGDSVRDLLMRLFAISQGHRDPTNEQREKEFGRVGHVHETPEERHARLTALKLAQSSSSSVSSEVKRVEKPRATGHVEEPEKKKRKYIKRSQKPQPQILLKHGTSTIPKLIIKLAPRIPEMEKAPKASKKDENKENNPSVLVQKIKEMIKKEQKEKEMEVLHFPPLLEEKPKKRKNSEILKRVEPVEKKQKKTMKEDKKIISSEVLKKEKKVLDPKENAVKIERKTKEMNKKTKEDRKKEVPVEVPAERRLAKELERLPLEPSRDQLKSLMNGGLTAEMLREAEKLIGREMARVNGLWWELVLRDYGRPTGEWFCGVRDIYKGMQAIERSRREGREKERIWLQEQEEKMKKKKKEQEENMKLKKKEQEEKMKMKKKEQEEALRRRLRETLPPPPLPPF